MDSKFIFCPLQVIEDHRLSLIQTRVLLALFSFRDNSTNTVWPLRKNLAERCGYKWTIISRTTTQLSELGWLKKFGDGGKNTA